MQEHDGHTVGAAAALPIERMQRVDGEASGNVRIDLGKRTESR
jgi:hypothetical protein